MGGVSRTEKRQGGSSVGRFIFPEDHGRVELNRRLSREGGRRGLKPFSSVSTDHLLDFGNPGLSIEGSLDCLE